MPTNIAAAEYDAIADVYDDLYHTESDHGENELVAMLVDNLTRGIRQIIDMGAGTGLLLDLHPRLTASTVNVDPSRGMLRRLADKHPGATTLVSDHNVILPPADLVVSLFGSPSYIPEDEVAGTLHRLTRIDGDALLMFGSPSHPGARFLEGAVDPGFTRWSVRDVTLHFTPHFRDVYACEVGNFTVAILRGKR